MEIVELKALIKESVREVLREERLLLCQVLMPYVSDEEQGVIPFTVLDIKKMKGEWEGFYRLLDVKIRVIFTVSLDSADLEIYTIGTRGDVYK